MNFRTQVQIPKSEFTIDHSTKMMLFGSCFSENIGLRLLEHKFNVVKNPFGILFNPLSITSAINRILSKIEFSENDLVAGNDLFHSFMHHGSFSGISKKEILDNINNHYFKALSVIESTDIFMITFGTSYVFKLKADDSIVSNCHKFSADNFQRFRLTIEDIVDEWNSLINILKNLNPKVKFIFTVSPIRHWKDGAHDNQISKSILHIAIEKLKYLYPDKVFYFPSYEIMIDELRDYRFYEEDMMHPNNIALNWIWEQFSNTYFSNKTLNINNEWSKIRKSLKHRPLHSDTDSYRKFVLSILNKIDVFSTKYPAIDCSSEKQFAQNLLQ